MLCGRGGAQSLAKRVVGRLSTDMEVEWPQKVGALGLRPRPGLSGRADHTSLGSEGGPKSPCMGWRFGRKRHLVK